jgi:hypothetical protein
MKIFFLILPLSLLLSIKICCLSSDSIASQTSENALQEMYSAFNQEFGAVSSFKEKFVQALDKDTTYALTSPELADKIQDPADLIAEKIDFQESIESFLNVLVTADYLTEQDKNELLTLTSDTYQKVVDFHVARLNAQKMLEKEL